MTDRQQPSLISISAALTLTLLAACDPAPTRSQPIPGRGVTQPSSPSPTRSAQASSNPNPGSYPSSASSHPMTSVTTTPTHFLWNPLSDVSIIEKTTFNGKIFDDTQAPLEGVTVSAKSLNSSVPFELTNIAAGGTYAFNNAPVGVQIEITVSKPGFTTRKRVEVLKINKVGDPNANKYDFGAGASSLGTASGALSDKPEVSVVTPGRNSAGVSPTTSFVLRFSEPMDRATVIDNFEVRAFTSKKLTVDTRADLNSDFTVLGSTGVNVLGSTRIWDKAGFNYSWNSDDTELTFTFKEERALPADKDSDKVPDYQVALERADKNIKDKSGISRSTDSVVPGDGGTGAFKLTEGNFERSYKFSIRTDTTRPLIDSITALTAENSGANSDGDAVLVRFSERMVFYTLGPTIAGGMGGVASQGAAANNALSAEAAAANYKLTVVRDGTTMLNQVSWASLGGRALFDSSDPTHKTVLLLPNPGMTSPARTATGGIMDGETMTGLVTYSDATAENVSVGVDAGSDGVGASVSSQDVQNALNTLETGADGFALSPLNTAAYLTPASYSYALANGSTRSTGVHSGKTISNVVLNGGTAGQATAITAANPHNIFPGIAPGQGANLFQPGDNVIVSVETTVLDPAGNSVDSSGDDASANAS